MQTSCAADGTLTHLPSAKQQDGRENLFHSEVSNTLGGGSGRDCSLLASPCDLADHFPNSERKVVCFAKKMLQTLKGI